MLKVERVLVLEKYVLTHPSSVAVRRYTIDSIQTPLLVASINPQQASSLEHRRQTIESRQPTKQYPPLRKNKSKPIPIGVRGRRRSKPISLKIK